MSNNIRGWEIECVGVRIAFLPGFSARWKKGFCGGSGGGGGGGRDGARGEYDFLPVPVPVRLLNLTKILFTVLVNVITLDGTYGIYQNSYFWDPTSLSSSSSPLSIIYVIIISLLCSSPLTSSSPAFIIWLSAMSAMLRALLKRGKILQYNRHDLENAELLQLIATGDFLQKQSTRVLLALSKNLIFLLVQSVPSINLIFLKPLMMCFCPRKLKVGQTKARC